MPQTKKPPAATTDTTGCNFPADAEPASDTDPSGAVVVDHPHFPTDKKLMMTWTHGNGWVLQKQRILEANAGILAALVGTSPRKSRWLYDIE